MHSYCAYFTRRYSENRSYLCKKTIKVIRNIKDIDHRNEDKARPNVTRIYCRRQPIPNYGSWHEQGQRKQINMKIPICSTCKKTNNIGPGDLRLLNADRSLAVPTELKLYAQKQLVRNQGAKTGSWRASCPAARRPRHTLC